MSDKIYQLPYDDVIDKDISDWLTSLPRSRKAEMVRNAIRVYLQVSENGNGNVIAVNPSLQVNIEKEATKPQKKRPNLPKDGAF